MQIYAEVVQQLNHSSCWLHIPFKNLPSCYY